MTATGAGCVSVGQQWFFEPYWNFDNTRFGPFRMDCSGYMVRIQRAVGNPPPPSALNSEGLDLWGRNVGLEIPLAQAFVTPGAFVSRWGVGDAGHIAMAVGDGQHDIETPAWGTYGHASGEASILGRDWTNASLAPNVDFNGHAASVNLEVLEASILSATRLSFGYPDVHPTAVTWLQVMLNRALPTRRRPLLIDGVYGPNTLQALQTWEFQVTVFLKQAGTFFPGGGEVNGTVWYWLRKTARI